MNSFFGILFSIIFRGILILGTAVGVWKLWTEYHQFLINFFNQLIK